MRSKKAFYNNIVSVVLQITILIFGLITPRLMIEFYGSELNGLVTSAKQITSYMKYLELGITSSLVFSLYQPLAYEDYTHINPLLSRTKKEYNKISFFYTFGVILIALIYPLFLKSNFPYEFLMLQIFLIGLFGAMDFYTLSKFRVLLTADQREYILNIATLIWTILYNLLSIFLIISKQSILIVIVVPTILLPVRSILLSIYVKKKYPKINFNAKQSKIKMPFRLDAFLSGLSNSLNLSLPIIVLSLMVSLEMASVYSVYSMIFIGIGGVLNVFTTGMSSAFGNMFAKGEKQTFIKNINFFEFVLYMFITVLLSSTLSLIIPFIKIYTKGIVDVNYVYPIIGLLFTVWCVIYTTKIPNEIVISATGNWKLGRHIYILQIILLAIGTGVFGYFLGINGILLGLIVSSVFKTISLSLVVNKKILNLGVKKNLFRMIRIFIIIFIINFPLIFNQKVILVNTYFEWIIASVLVVIITIFITIIMNFIFEKNTFKELFIIHIKPRISKLKKSKSDYKP